LFNLLLSKLSHWWDALSYTVYECSYAYHRDAARESHHELTVLDEQQGWATQLRSKYGIAQPMVEEE
jgi:hypothetical protein